ncbi:hypothetical protein VQ056_09990 [Paenibacillus sp. JTLBN-2024]
MAYLDFHPNDYSVTYKSDTIVLLAKEYALLQFLYRHAGRPFTRSSCSIRCGERNIPANALWTTIYIASGRS